ncbi:MAG: hypothetical protein COB53_04940 [Elusimicrobia bacterium]|nr:MAG: hypothetical protein COB53_04940 [Elusimicrobiota bacterium]
MAFAAFLLAGLLAAPVWAGPRQTSDNTGTSHINYQQQRLNYIPGITSDKREQDDPDFTGDPDREDLITMIGHVADLIADRNIPQDSLPGVDLFMDNLQEEMELGSDIPRYKILRNANDARKVLVDGYDALRHGLVPMIVAHEKLKAVEKGLKPIIKKNISEDVPAIKEAAETLKPPVSAMQPDPPTAPGPPANAAAVKPISDQNKEIKPLKPHLEAAKEKLKEAKKFISIAEAIVPTLKQYSKKAGDLEKDSQDRLAKSRTSAGTRYVGRQGLSRKVLENAQKWMKKTVKKAKAVHKEMEALTSPKEGYPKTLGAAEKASAAAMAAKQGIEAAAQGINQKQTQIKGPIRSAWERAKDESEKQQQVQKATEQKSQAEEAEQKGSKTAEKAKKASDKSKAAAKKTTEKLKKLRDKFGNPADADRLSDLPPMGIRVAQPKAVAPTGGRSISRNVKSRKLSYPQDLSRNTADVICDTYGERDCRTPGGSGIGRSAADRSGLTGELAGRVTSARGIAQAALGGWQSAWRTGKKTLAGGARPGPGPLPKNLAAIKPALVTAKNAEALVETYPRQAIAMANASIRSLPNNPYAYFVQAKAHMRLRNYPQALAALDKAILQDEGRSALLLRTKAELLNRMGRYEEAVEFAQEAIAAEKEDAHGFAQASWGFAGMRKYAQSLEMMESAAEFDGTYKPLLAAMRQLKDHSRLLVLFEGERIAVEPPSRRTIFFKFLREGKQSYWIAFSVAVCLVGLGFFGIVFDLSKEKLRRFFSGSKSPRVQ